MGSVANCVKNTPRRSNEANLMLKKEKRLPGQNNSRFDVLCCLSRTTVHLSLSLSLSLWYEPKKTYCSGKLTPNFIKQLMRHFSAGKLLFSVKTCELAIFRCELFKKLRTWNAPKVDKKKF